MIVAAHPHQGDQGVPTRREEVCDLSGSEARGRVRGAVRRKISLSRLPLVRIEAIDGRGQEVEAGEETPSRAPGAGQRAAAAAALRESVLFLQRHRGLAHRADRPQRLGPRASQPRAHGVRTRAARAPVRQRDDCDSVQPAGSRQNFPHDCDREELGVTAQGAARAARAVGAKGTASTRTLCRRGPHFQTCYGSPRVEIVQPGATSQAVLT